MCPANRLDSQLRKAEVLHFTFLDQVFHCSSYIFDWHLRVNTVLVKQVNSISGTSITLYRDDLPKGEYLIELTEGNKLVHADKLVVKD